jgi:hypothetical protein
MLLVTLMIIVACLGGLFLRAFKHLMFNLRILFLVSAAGDAGVLVGLDPSSFALVYVLDCRYRRINPSAGRSPRPP